jgi:hypothetical protein
VIFGFGGKKRFYFKQFDTALRACGVHPVLVEDAVRLTVLRMVEELPARAGVSENDRVADGMQRAGALTALLLQGSEETARHIDAAAMAELRGRLVSVAERPEQDGLDSRVIRLILVLGRADQALLDEVGLDLDT